MGRTHFQAHLRGSWQDSDLSRLLDSCLNSPELLAGDFPQFPAMEAFPQSSSQYGSHKRECRKQNASNPNTEVAFHHVCHLLFITSESLGSAHAPRDSIKTEYQEVEFVGRYARSCLPFTHNFVVKMNRLNKIFTFSTSVLYVTFLPFPGKTMSKWTPAPRELVTLQYYTLISHRLITEMGRPGVKSLYWQAATSIYNVYSRIFLYLFNKHTVK